MEKNELTEEIVKRYILISFWIEYRAGVHRGDGITIKPMSADEYLKNKRKIHDLVGLIKEKYPDKVKNYNPDKEINLDENFYECETRRKHKNIGNSPNSLHQNSSHRILLKKIRKPDRLQLIFTLLLKTLMAKLSEISVPANVIQGSVHIIGRNNKTKHNERITNPDK